MLKLSDLQAPVWVWNTGVPGSAPTSMRPLSLATFAEAELMGCGLDALLDETNQESSVSAWIKLYAFLRRDDPEMVAQEVLMHPQVFAAFVEQVQSTFKSPDKEQGQQSHRRSKDPREFLKSQEPKREPQEHAATDYSVVFTIARYARISVDDIFKMTFTGLAGLTQHLNDNPPEPTGLF